MALTRSQMMARVKSRNTRPELKLRRALHALGVRYRLHRQDLPGSPDLVLPGARIAVFVHGCFWHRHAGCKEAAMPATRVDYWTRKFRRNVQRDAQAQAALGQLGWHVVVAWECEIDDRDKLESLVQRLLVAQVRASLRAERGHAQEPPE